MKNKSVLIGIAFLLLIVLGGGAYMMMSKSDTASPSTVADAMVATPSGGGSVQKTLKELFTSGVAQKCTFSNTSETPAVQGVTYISSGKVRGDFTTAIADKTITSHMIVEGNTNYMWTDEQKIGFKMTMDTDAATTPMPTGSAMSQQAFDMNKTMEYNCSPWVVDASLFVPPTNIEFSDFSDMLKSSGEGIPAGNQTACKACEQLTGESKTQCQTALGCE